MNDKETFCELVRCAERLSRPWKLAFVISNALWVTVLLVLTR